MNRLQVNSAATLETAVDATVDCLLGQGVVAAPTETVYGLLTLWDNSAGRDRIFMLKERPSDKRLQMLAGSLKAALQSGVRPEPRLRLIADRFWPGPLTVVCASVEGDSIGLRVPQHPFMTRLLARLPQPLAATSANLSGAAPARKADAAVAGLRGTPDLLVDGGRVKGTASTVISILAPEIRLLRAGPITLQEIQAALDD